MKSFFRNIAAYWAGLEKRFYAGPSFLYRMPRKGRLTKNGKTAPPYISPSMMLGVWGYGFVQLFLPPQGWLFLWSYLAIGFYSSIMTRSPALFLFLAMTIALGLNIVYRVFFAPRLRIKRVLPKLTCVNTCFTVIYEVENTSFFPAFDVTLEPFLRFPELEMEDRKRYAFKGREKRTLKVRFLLKKRGIYTFPRPGAESSFPFGLFRKSFLGEKSQTPDSIAVAPGISDRKWNIFSGDPKSRRGGFSPEKRKRHTPRKKRHSASLEFVGLREYRQGDEIRHIHFPSSARKGELVMKEFQEEEKEHFLLVLDPCLPRVARWKDWGSMCLSLFRKGKVVKPEEERERLLDQMLEDVFSCIGKIREELQGEVDLMWTDGTSVKILRNAGEGELYSRILPLTLAGMESSSLENRWQEAPLLLQEEEEGGTILYFAPFASPEGEKMMAALRRVGEVLDLTMEKKGKKNG